MACVSIDISSYREKGLGLHQQDSDWNNFCIGAIEVLLAHYYSHPKTGALFEIEGSYEGRFWCGWTKYDARFWGDPDYAIQFGAYGFAIFFIERFTHFSVINTFPKDDGFDLLLRPKYNINKDEDELEDNVNFAGRLQGLVCAVKSGDSRAEVSGTSNKKLTKSRTRKKEKQISASDNKFETESYVVVVDFQVPKIVIVHRNEISKATA